MDNVYILHTLVDKDLMKKGAFDLLDREELMEELKKIGVK